MAHGNTKVQERFELSLGGFQIAGIVVGSLVALSLVFLLGFQVGQRVGERRAQAARPAGLPELDAAAAAQPQPPVSPGEITFAQELPKAKPPPPPPPKPSASQSAASDPKAGTKGDATPPEPAAAPPGDADAPEAQPAWTVQLGAAQTRAEAEVLADRVRALGPRIEEADVPGKGHWFRVRAGRFDTRAAADKYRNDVVRETGIGAVVVPAGT
jgi:cell division septation protein DedD